MTVRSEMTSGPMRAEVKDFPDIVVSSLVAFSSLVVVAHILVWLWRPWL
ncbi:MAG: light-harvesting protein [Sphingobacteriia bacterium]|nr:light-harvesting protein [Sphingobacteriia bacterium]NCC38252.1 light-harvesting protein [Gammaproteobacteria bacterium]